MSFFLPAGILDYFDVVDYQTNSTHQELFTKDLKIFLVEKPIVPEECLDASAKASGFMEACKITDYPIRDLLVKLNIKRHRWDLMLDRKKQKANRDWNLVLESIRMSEDYSAFLKEISQY